MEVLKAPINRVKEGIPHLQNFFKSKLGAPVVSLHALLYASFGFMIFLTLLKGMGTHSRGIPSKILPSKMKTMIGSGIFADPAFGPALTTLMLAAIVSIAGAWILGSFLAIAQLKSGIKGLRFLPMFPILITPIIIGYTLGSIQSTLPGEILIQSFLTIGFLFPCISIFYVIYTRFFQLVPESQLEIAKLLGAADDVAHSTIYSPFYLIGTLFSVLLCILYIFSSHAMGYFMKSEKALGFVIMNKLEFPEGYLMMGAYAFPLLIATLILVMMMEAFVPFACLFPMGVARPKTHPEYIKMSEWLALIGSIFYSPSCYRRPRGNIKDQEEKADLEEISEETPDKLAEPEASNKQVEKPKSALNVSLEDDEEEFDD